MRWESILALNKSSVVCKLNLEQMNQPVSDFIITNLQVSILNSDFLSFFESYFTVKESVPFCLVCDLCASSVLQTAAWMSSHS